VNFIQTLKTFLTCAAMPLYLGGGGGSSQANTSTATTTHSSSVNTDQSMMGGDNAIGLNGSGNVIDKSVVNNTAFSDYSDKSTTFTDNSVKDSSTKFYDSSVKDSSTKFTDSSVKNDSSNHSTNYSSTTTDFGSVTAALAGMGQLSSQALTTAGQMTKDGLASVSAQSKDNLAVLNSAFTFASAATAADVTKYGDVLGFAKDTIQKTADAYADAKDGGTNKTLTIAAVAVIGAVGVAAAFGRI
jgi:hypothetical protein